MANINVPGAAGHASGDLARCVTHELDDQWPTMIEIVAYWQAPPGKRGRRRVVTISADEFFGRNGHGAPMSGDSLLRKIDDLRRRR